MGRAKRNQILDPESRIAVHVTSDQKGNMNGVSLFPIDTSRGVKDVWMALKIAAMMIWSELALGRSMSQILTTL
jgi:hypothetical protein